MVVNLEKNDYGKRFQSTSFLEWNCGKNDEEDLIVRSWSHNVHQLVQFSRITLVVPSKWPSRLLQALKLSNVELRINPLPMYISVRTNLACTPHDVAHDV